MTFIGLNDGAATMIDIDKMDAVMKVNNEKDIEMLFKSVSSHKEYLVGYNDTKSLSYDFEEIRKIRDFIKIKNHLIRLEAIEGFSINDAIDSTDNRILCIILRGGFLVEITMDKANANAYYEEIRKQIVLM